MTLELKLLTIKENRGNKYSSYKSGVVAAYAVGRADGAHG